MIIVDINILIFAYDSTTEHHNQAREWLENALNNNEMIGIPWVVISGFYKILSGKLSNKTPATLSNIIEIIESWAHNDMIEILQPSSQFQHHFVSLLKNYQVRGKLTSDTFLAALALENGAKIASNDIDFSRFEKAGLQWFNPLK